MARKHRKKSTRLEIPHVALLIETSIGSGRDILAGISRYMRTQGRWSVFQQPRNLMEPFPDWLRSWRGDGIIARIQDERMADLVTATNIPAVDVLGVVRHPKIPVVHVDDSAIARMTAEHLLAQGFCHFGFFGIKAENWSEFRRDEFKNIVTVAGHSCQIFEILRSQLEQGAWEAQEDNLVRWVKALPKPTALMVSTDTCGPMLLEACRRSGVKVPDEIAIVGVGNDVLICELSDPPLSSVNCNLQRVGFEAATLLERLMSGKKSLHKTELIKPLEIVTRLSSDVVAVDDPSVRTAVRFIREHACEDIGVNHVAESSFLSRSVLQRRFRSLLGRSVHDEILRCRLQRATRLLSETDQSIAQIAETAGFKYQQYMGAVFQKELGETPAQWRVRTKPNAFSNLVIHPQHKPKISMRQ